MAVRPSWPLPDRLARAPRVGALFFGDKAVLVSCSPASSVQPLTDFLVAKQKCVSFPICFSPPGMGSDCGRASCSHVGRLSPVSVLKMCRHQRAEERPRRKNKERQRRGRRGLHRGPSPRPNSTRAGPAACGARSAPASRTARSERGATSQPCLESAVTAGTGRHTHSCMERLQYSMWRGVPLRLNWSTV